MVRVLLIVPVAKYSLRFVLVVELVKKKRMGEESNLRGVVKKALVTPD
jgi:hypothetical protein